MGERLLNSPTAVVPAPGNKSAANKLLRTGISTLPI